MSQEAPLELGVDLSTYERKTRTATVCSARVIIISPNGNFILVHYKDTPWLGLPGGKVKAGEYKSNGNLLSEAAFSTLARETQEECGLPIHPNLANTSCLALTEIAEVNNYRQKVIWHLTPIFIYSSTIPPATELKKGVVVANINEHLGGPLFPDARMVISYLQRQWQSGAPIFTPRPVTYLEPKRPLFFQIKPNVGPLWGPPDWYK